MIMDKLPVVVFRANDICFLGIIRSLSLHNIPFRTVDFTWPNASPWWSEFSIYYKPDIHISNPFDSEIAALTLLISEGKKLRKEWGQPLLAIPSSDTNLMFLINNEDILSPYFTLMGDKNFDSYRRDIVDKYECSRLLCLNGLEKNIPKTYPCYKMADISNIKDNIVYPCIFKPSVKDYGQSFYSMHQGLKAVECNSFDELSQGINRCLSHDIDLIIQEKIYFDSHNDEIPFYAYVDQFHKIRMAATGYKTLIQPYPYGTANILQLTWYSELLQLAQQVVSSIKWRGIIMIEFIKDKKDLTWKIIEVNTRPWLFIGFYEQHGLNYLNLLYQDWVNDLPLGQELYTPCEELIFSKPLHVDLQGIYHYFDANDKRRLFGANADNLIKWLSTYSTNLSFTYYSENDKLPGIESLKSIICNQNDFTNDLFDEYLRKLYNC